MLNKNSFGDGKHDENHSAEKPGLTPAIKKVLMSMHIDLNHIDVEKRTVEAMINIYCRGQGHHSPCADCDTLKEYALKRLDKCPYGENKPSCKQCPVHCYHPAKREQIRKVMRYAGPNMLWKHPWLSIRYKFSQLINKSTS